jgi:hypothetical protein
MKLNNNERLIENMVLLNQTLGHHFKNYLKYTG